jgi:hypothetical protein
MLDPLVFMDVANIPTNDPATEIAMRLITPTDENLKIVADLKNSINKGLAADKPGSLSTTMVDGIDLNDSMPQGLTPLLVSPSGKAGFFRRADGALVQRLNGKMSVM